MALKDVIIGYAKGDKGDKGDTGERGATGQTGPQGEPGNIADAAITDTQGLDVAKGAKTTAQKLFDAIADRIVNKLVTNDTLTTKLADYLLKSAMSSTNINSTTNVPTSALVYSLLQDVNNNLSKTDERVTRLYSDKLSLPQATIDIGASIRLECLNCFVLIYCQNTTMYDLYACIGYQSDPTRSTIKLLAGFGKHKISYAADDSSDSKTGIFTITNGNPNSPAYVLRTAFR